MTLYFHIFCGYYCFKEMQYAFIIYRFVEKGSNRNQYSFSIPAGGCGTTDSDLGSRSNILIFQFDPILQVKLFINFFLLDS